MKKIIPIEEGDFYWSENGYRVFTKQYHLKRGYCCESGCRHCPYGYDKKTNSQNDERSLYRLTIFLIFSSVT